VLIMLCYAVCNNDVGSTPLECLTTADSPRRAAAAGCWIDVPPRINRPLPSKGIQPISNCVGSFDTHEIGLSNDGAKHRETLLIDLAYDDLVCCCNLV
jgi:hypothetical protein